MCAEPPTTMRSSVIATQPEPPPSAASPRYVEQFSPIEAARRLQKVIIENKDCKKLIAQYDRPRAYAIRRIIRRIGTTSGVGRRL